MEKNRDNKNFWNRYAKLYDFEINKFNGKAYTRMYRLMAGALSPDMKVLEVATGTGLIAANIATHVFHVTAIDFSPKMIKKAKQKKAPENIHFAVENAMKLPYADNSFDAVIISNALHIMPDPIKVLSNISRVLKPKGLLIAPTYAHGLLPDASWNLSVKILKFIGFETYSKWKPETYVEFIQQNGFRVETWQLLNAAFPLVYLEAQNQKELTGASGNTTAPRTNLHRRKGEQNIENKPLT